MDLMNQKVADVVVDPVLGSNQLHVMFCDLITK